LLSRPKRSRNEAVEPYEEDEEEEEEEDKIFKHCRTLYVGKCSLYIHTAFYYANKD
jgi:hypothetical protein